MGTAPIVSVHLTVEPMYKYLPLSVGELPLVLLSVTVTIESIYELVEQSKTNVLFVCSDITASGAL